MYKYKCFHGVISQLVNNIKYKLLHNFDMNDSQAASLLATSSMFRMLINHLIVSDIICLKKQKTRG